MTKILRLLIYIFAALTLIKIYSAIHKRVRAVFKLRSLKKAGADVRLFPAILLSHFRISKSPDAIVKIGKRIYLIRFLSGRSALSFVHFASERFATVYSKMRFSVGNLLSRRRGTKGNTLSDTSRQKVYVIPKLEIPKEYEAYETHEIIKAIMLDPEPAEVTFVTKEKTSIKAAYTGDEVYGQLLFTSDTFVTYADRMKRNEEYLGDKNDIHIKRGVE